MKHAFETQGFFVVRAGIPPDPRDAGWQLAALVPDGVTEAIVGADRIPIGGNALVLGGRRDRPDAITLVGPGATEHRIDTAWLAEADRDGLRLPPGPVEISSRLLPDPPFVHDTLQSPDITQARIDELNGRIDRCMAANGATKKATQPPDAQGYYFADPDRRAQYVCWAEIAAGESYYASPEFHAADRIAAFLLTERQRCFDARHAAPDASSSGEKLSACSEAVNVSARRARRSG